MHRENKVSIPVVILLTIFTCGIYSFFWLYKTSFDIKQYIKSKEINPGLDVVLSLVTCGLYTIYWFYRTGKDLSVAQREAGVMVTDDALVLVLISIFGFGIVAMCILQYRLNEVWDNA